MSTRAPQRLSRAAEFDRVYRQGRSASHRFLVVYRFERPDDVRADDDGSCRIGITVSRKHGGAAVRNRLKRQLRESTRRQQWLPDASDLVFIARSGLAAAAETKDGEWLDALVADLIARTFTAKERAQLGIHLADESEDAAADAAQRSDDVAASDGSDETQNAPTPE